MSFSTLSAPSPACCQCGSNFFKNLMISLDSRAVHCADCLLGNERANRNAIEGYATLLERQHQTQLEQLRKDHSEQLAVAAQRNDAADKLIATALSEQHSKLSKVREEEKEQMRKVHEAEKEQMRKSQQERVKQLLALESSKADEKLKIALVKQQAALSEKFRADHRLQQQNHDQRLAFVKSAAVKEQAASLQKTYEAEAQEHKAQQNVRIDELSKRVQHSERALSDATERGNDLSRSNAKLLTDKKIQKEEWLRQLSKKEKTIDRLTVKQKKTSKEVEDLSEELKQDKWHLKAMQNQQEPMAAQLVMVAHQKQTLEEQVLHDRRHMQQLQKAHEGAVHKHEETMRQMREYCKRLLLQLQGFREKEKKLIEEAAKFVSENAVMVISGLPLNGL